MLKCSVVSGHHTLPWANRLRLNQSTPGAVGAWTKHLEDMLVHWDQLFISMVGNKALYTTKQKNCCFNHYLSCLRSKSVLYKTWLVVYQPLWKMMEFVGWDYDIPNWMGKNQQPDTISPQTCWLFWFCSSSHPPTSFIKTASESKRQR